jgi:hypothetical protein
MPEQDPYAAITVPVAGPTQKAAVAPAPATAAPAQNSSDPYASIAVPVNDTDSSKLTPAGAAGGFMKPMAEATTGIGNLIGRGAEIILGKPKGSLTGSITSEQPLDHSGVAGQIAGDTAQWMAGEGAISKLAELADTAGAIAKASEFLKTPTAWAEYLKQSPKATWLLKAISNMGTGAATGAAVGGTQGAATGNGVQGAERGAAFGAGAAAVAPVIEGIVSKIPNPWAAARSAARGVTDAAANTSVAKALTGSDIQSTLKSGITDVWNTVAQNEGVPTLGHNISVRDQGKQIGEYILDRSKTAYKQIDEATGGKFQPLEDKIKAVNQKLRGVTNDEEEQKVLADKTRLMWQQDQVFDEAAKNGVDRKIVEVAKADFKKAQAIFDINDQIQKASTEGVKLGGKGADIDPERVNASALQKRLNVMQNSGRIQQGVGDEATEELINHTTTAKVREAKIAKLQAVAKGIARIVGMGGAVEAAGHIAPILP